MIAITGAAGFIGSVLAWKLNTLSHEDLLLVDVGAKNAASAGGGSASGGKWENVRKRKFEIYLEAEEFARRLEKNEFRGKLSALFHLGMSRTASCAGSTAAFLTPSQLTLRGLRQCVLRRSAAP